MARFWRFGTRRRNTARTTQPRQAPRQATLKPWLEVLEDRLTPAIRAALIAAEATAAYTADVRAKILAADPTMIVDIIQANTSTPSLATLMSYNAVLTWSNDAYQNPTLLGDTLANYVDAGRGVVQMTFSFDTFAGFGLTGRWVTGNYGTLTRSRAASGFGLTLGAVLQPTHPIMAGVSTFAGGLITAHHPSVVAAGATGIANWSNGRPLVAARTNFAGRVAGLNFWPVSNTVDVLAGWQAAGHGGRMMANALNWAASADVPDTVGTALGTGMGPGVGTYTNNSILADGTFGLRDVDMYSFQATAGQQLVAQTTSTGGIDANTILRLFNAGGTELAVDDNGNGAPYSRITFTIPTTGTYYVGVSGFSNSLYNPNLGGSGSVMTGTGGAYRLSLQTTAPSNVPPSGVTVTPPVGGFLEGTLGAINVSFTDPDVANTHNVAIDWDNDGVFEETFTLPVGQRAFSRNHTYADDGPSPGNGTTADPKTIVVQVSDGLATATGSAATTVNNAAPSAVAITNGPFTISENGSFTLNGSFIDPGLLDVHTVDIDWDGDGTFEFSSILATGARTFSFASPTYADDGPSPGNNTPFDVNNVNVRVRDDDTGAGLASTTLTVNNVAPNTVAITNGPFTISEGGAFTLNGSFVDPGLLDVHAVDVDWNGDGTFDFSTTLALGARTFSIASPTYADDGPSPGNGTPFDVNNVNVRVRDDDTGEGLASTMLTINNVAPSAVTILGGPITINENGSFTLAGSFVDPGTLDVHTVDVDWDGDGTYDTSLTLAVGDRTFSIASPVFADDNPTGTAFDVNNVNVRVSDDDAGEGTASTTLRINNVAPTITGFTAIAGVDGSGNAVTCNPVPFQVDLTDPSPAASETFRYEFDWNGDMVVDEVFPTTGFTASRSITILHEFDVTSTIRGRGVDDDTGLGAWFTRTIAVVPVTMVGGNLVVGGSNGNDNITVNATNPAAVMVTRNSSTFNFGPFNLTAPGARIIIHGCDGIDTLTVNGPVPAEIFGGNGNDFIFGGSGNDQLWGEAGDDIISAGGGDDVAVGGAGKDQLTGSNGNDVLVGGLVDPMLYSWAQLQQVVTDWNGWTSTGTPPATLTALRDATTDPADAANVDRYSGSTGKDLFVYRSGTGGDLVNDYSLTAKDYLLALL